MNQQLMTDAYCYYLECLFEQCVMELSDQKHTAVHQFNETEHGIQLIVKVGEREVYNNEIVFLSKRRMIEVFLFDSVKLLNK